MPFLFDNPDQRFRGKQPKFVPPLDNQGLGAGFQLLMCSASGPIDLVNGRVWTPGGNAHISTGPFGRSLDFDGVDDYYTYTGYPEIVGNVGTLVCWLPRVGVADTFGQILLSDSGGVYHQIVSLSSILFGTAGNSAGSLSSWFSTNNRCLVMASNGTGAGTKVYLDGVDTGMAWTSAPTGHVAGAKTFHIGNYVGGANWDFDGSMLIMGRTRRVWGVHEAKACYDSKGSAIFRIPRKWVFFSSAGVVTLTGENATQANASSTDGITQTHVLTVANAAQANPSSADAITQTQILTAANAAQANSGGTGAITQDHVLTGANAAQANDSSNVEITLGIALELTVDPSAQANTSGTGVISQTHALTIATSVQANTASDPAITQAQILAGANAAQANNSATGAISIAPLELTVDSSTQVNASGTGAISQTHVLVMAPSVQDSIAEASVIVQSHILAIANTAQANSGGTGAISISTGNLEVAPSTQINLGGTGAISLVGIVADQFLADMVISSALKKPGVPSGTPEWLKTTLEIMLGRRNNKITVPGEQALTFSATPTQAEVQALYAYLNEVRGSLNELVNRLDS